MADRVPCIALHQPFASLCFVDDIDLRKIHETRGRAFPAKYQGTRIAISATAAFPSPKEIAAFRGLHDLAVAAFGSNYRHELPRGVLLGTVLFVTSAGTGVTAPESGSDLIAGNWAPGRFAMRLAKPQRLSPPVPWKSKQGWFFVDLPEPSIDA